MRVKESRFILILLSILLGLATISPLHAHTRQHDTLTIEEEQQFLYYFYEVERLIQMNRITEAKPIVAFCYAINPNNATINNYMGLYAQSESESEKAAAYFKRAYELCPEEYWYNYHILLLQSDNKKLQKQAIQQMEALAKEDSMNEELHTVLQKAYIVQEKYQHALLVQDQLDSIRGYDDASAMQRYRLQLAMKNIPAAIREIERYLEMDAENYQFQVFRMQLYEQTNQPPKKMIEAYEAVLRFDPTNVVVMNNLAWNMCISHTNLMRAEELSRTTILRESSNPIYIDTYAWIMYQLGDCTSAKFFIERAIELLGDKADKEIKMHYKTIIKACKE